MITSLPTIPDDLRQDLEDLRPHLQCSGGSIRPRKRDGIYSLRIRIYDPGRGYKVHRRLTLGDERMALAVKTLIDSWRQEYDAWKGDERRQREEGLAYDARIKEIRQAFLAQASGPSERRRLAREFDAVAGSPVQLCAYLVGGSGGPSPPGRPGPKPQSGLC